MIDNKFFKEQEDFDGFFLNDRVTEFMYNFGYKKNIKDIKFVFINVRKKDEELLFENAECWNCPELPEDVQELLTRKYPTRYEEDRNIWCTYIEVEDEDEKRIIGDFIKYNN